MCPRCGTKPAPDRTLCRHCGEKRARPSAQEAPGPSCRHSSTAAETRNGPRVPRDRIGGAIGHGGTLFSRARAHPGRGHGVRTVHVARRDRERWNNMPRGESALWAGAASAYCDRCARSAAKRSRKKAIEYKKPPALRPAARFVRLCRSPRTVPVSPVRPPVLGTGRASRSAGSATSSYGHRDRLGGQSWDMGPKM